MTTIFEKNTTLKLGTALRDRFPVFASPVHFLDSAASAQKPDVVISAVENCYRSRYANVHRGVYDLSETATSDFETARLSVARFLNAASADEIVFTRGTTESINLVAYSYARKFLKKGDEILLSIAEHHSNIVPWQLVAEEVGLQISFVNLTDTGHFDIADFRKKLTDKTKLVAVSQLANALGITLPVKEIITEAHARGAKVLIDGAQVVAHQSIDVQALDADFYVFSGHKLYGPSGIGVLYGKSELLSEMPPFQGGGSMINFVTTSGSDFAKPPARFEAGTPNIAGAVGLKAAIEFVSEIGLERIAQHETRLVRALEEGLSSLPAVNIQGPVGDLHALVSFTINKVHPHDIAQILNSEEIALRAGHHCAQPLMTYLGIGATARASFGVYNDIDDIQALLRGVQKVVDFFKVS